MATAKIAEAINSIPEKKEDLRKAFEVLQSYSSSFASFTLQWKDLDDHFSAIEKSIEDRFMALQAKDTHPSPSLPSSPSPPGKMSISPAKVPEPTPRPELRSLCVQMDAKGLRSYISDNRKDLLSIRDELAPAIRSASDPAALVLDAMEGFFPPKSKGEKEGETQINRRTCINLLERIQLIQPEIKPSVKEKAKKLAVEWKGKISNSGDSALAANGFLQLIASYGLVSEFKFDDVLELFVLVSRRKQALDLIKGLGLVEKLSDIIQKLNSKGRQLDAVKFVYAFDMVEKFPPAPLLKAYVKESKRAAQEVRKKGNNSRQAQNEALAKEMGALKSVLKAVEEYRLETEYPRQNLEKRIAQLEQQKAGKKRPATAAASSNSKNQQLQQEQPNKRARPSAATAAPATVVNPYPQLVQTQHQLGLADRGPYMPGPYGLAATGSVYNHPGQTLSGAATGSVYNHPGQSLSGAAYGHAGPHSPPRSYLYSSESLAGTSGLYDRPASYSGYPLSGLPPSYGSSLYQ